MRFIIIFFPILFGTTVASEGMFSWLFSSGEEITARVKLVNKCQLDSKYFIARDLESGKSAPFINGYAKLSTKTKSSIQLQLSKSVKNVTFSGNAVAAKKKMLNNPIREPPITTLINSTSHFGLFIVLFLC